MASRYWVGGTNTWNATAGTKWATTSGGAGGAAVPTASDDVFFDANSGAANVSPSSGLCKNLDFTGFTGTFSGSSGVSVSGSLTWGAGMSQLHTGPITFNATSVQTITSNGKAFGGAITFNGVGGSWQQQDALSTTGTITLTNGAFDTNAKNLTCGSFSLSGAAVRSLNMAGSTVTVTSNWSFSSSTNFTLSAAGSSLVFAHNVLASNTMQSGGLTYGDVTFAGSAGGSLTISGGPFTVRDFTISNTGGASFVSSTTLNVTRDFIFSGFIGAWTGSGGAISVGRHFATSAGMTATNITSLTFTATSGTSTLTTNGVALNNNLTFNGVGGSWVFQDALTTSRRITLTNGSLNTNGKTVVCSSLYSINSNVRSLDLTNTTLTLNAQNINVFDLTGSGMTFSAAGSLISVDNTGSVAGQVQDFNQGARSYGTVRFIGTGAGGLSLQSSTAGATFSSFVNASLGLSLRILGDNTFGTVALNNPHTLTLAAGSTQTIGALTMSGSAGNPLAIRSTVPGVPAMLSVPKNYVAGDYIDAQDCIATGGARWFAGKHGVNSGGNNGWRFSDAAPRSAFA